MIIMGVDPGTATTGVGVIEGSKKSRFKCLFYGCITTKKEQPIEKRLGTIFIELNKLVKTYKPNLISIEQLFFNTNPKTAMSVGRASGVIILSTVVNKIDMKEFTPLQVKSAVSGYGRAKKTQVQKMIATLLNLKTIPKPDDAADALAIAYCAGVSL